MANPPAAQWADFIFFIELHILAPAVILPAEGAAASLVQFDGVSLHPQALPKNIDVQFVPAPLLTPFCHSVAHGRFLPYYFNIQITSIHPSSPHAT